MLFLKFCFPSYLEAMSSTEELVLVLKYMNIEVCTCRYIFFNIISCLDVEIITTHLNYYFMSAESSVKYTVYLVRKRARFYGLE